jgi:hypothetical protein
MDTCTSTKKCGQEEGKANGYMHLNQKVQSGEG